MVTSICNNYAGFGDVRDDAVGLETDGKRADVVQHLRQVSQGKKKKCVQLYDLILCCSVFLGGSRGRAPETVKRTGDRLIYTGMH